MRILYLTANAQFAEPPKDSGLPPAPGQDYPALDLWPELGGVTNVLFNARAEGRVQLEVVPEVRRSDVSRYLAERPINVLHFSGHGEKDQPLDARPDGETEHRLILMDTEHEGMFGEYVDNDWLREQLQGQGLTVIVLNCCWSAGVAEKLKGVADCVIGTTIALREDLAKEFSTLFYQGLEKGLTLNELRELLEKDNRFKDLYHFAVSNPDAMAQAIAPIPYDERDLTPARKALGRRTDLASLRAQLDGWLGIESYTIAIAIAIAVGGWFLIDGLIKPLIPSSLQWLGDMLKWQPAAVMAGIIGNPLGRLAAQSLMRSGINLTDRMLKALALCPPAQIERELTTGRVAAMFAWIEKWKGKPELVTYSSKGGTA
jgi:hypothetical protein